MKRGNTIIRLISLLVLYSVFSCENVTRLTNIRTTAAVSVGAGKIYAFAEISDLSDLPHERYGFCYDTLDNPTYFNHSIQSGNTPVIGSFATLISSVVIGKTYYVRAYILEGGQYLYGDVIRVQPCDVMTDPRDGFLYGTVKIGNQTWLCENLRYASPSGSWVYNNDIANEVLYGRLYDWNTAIHVAPQGWRLPTKDDWGQLIYFLGGPKAAYEKLVVPGNSGMNVFAGGYSNSNVDFCDAGKVAYFWTSSEIDTIQASCCFVNQNIQTAYTGQYIKTSSFSVRCIKE